jgi:uncharacterized protein with ParB-like and HNH nuclease domain
MQNLESIQSIFKEGIFKIPDYQRGYAWTIKQLQDFWEDIINLPEDKKHYTGVLTLKEVSPSVWKNWNEEAWLIQERSYKPYHVVDGQQRLTTIVVFIQSLIEIIENLPENEKKSSSEIYLGSYSLKEIKETYLVIQKPPQQIIKTYLFSYEKDNPSFDFLRYKILNEKNSGKVDETFYTLNLANSKRFFIDNIKIYLEEFGIEGVTQLFRKVTQNLKFNKYEIANDFDVFVAFETMNNRGKQLSNLELLKNRLIYLTTLYEDSELETDERESLRTKINDAWKGVYHQLGRDKKHPLNDDDFLMAHWIMYFQYSRKKGNDYIRFLLDSKFSPKNIFNKIEVQLKDLEDFEELTGMDDIEEYDDDEEVNTNGQLVSKLSPKEIEEYVGSLKTVAVHWYNTYHPINNPDLTEQEQLWLDRLNRMGMLYFRPLVTTSFVAPNVTSEDRIQLFKAIERFIFITFRLGRYLSTYRNSEFFRAARELRVGSTTIKDIITALDQRMKPLFYSPEGQEEEYFDYTHFKKYLQRKYQNGVGFYGWNALRYFLYEYEMEKVRNRGSKKIDWSLFVKSSKDKVSIEHILPQTPSKDCWKEVVNGWEPKELNLLTNSLGNLLPLSMSINSSLQNDCFLDKVNPKYGDDGNKIRQGYKDGSHSEIEVIQLADGIWNDTRIQVRGLKMLKFMETRWGIKFESTDAMLDTLFLKNLSVVRNE